MGDHYNAINELSIMQSLYLSKRYELFQVQSERYASKFPEQDNPYAVAGMPGGDQAVVLTVTGERTPADYNLRGEEGNMIKLDTFKDKLIDIPFIREKIHLKKKEMQLLRRVFGAGSGRAQSAAMEGSTILIGRLLEKLKKRATIRHNASRAEIITTGKLTIVIEGITYELDYGIPAANIVSKATTLAWTESTATPLTDIAVMIAQIQQESGLDCVQITSRNQALTTFLEHPDVAARLSDQIKQQLLATGQVGKVLGLDWVVDDSGYKNAAGTFVNHYLTDELVFTPVDGSYAYMEKGELDDFGAPEGSTGTFVKSFVEEEPSRITLIAEDSRLPILGVPEGVGILKINE